MKKFDISREFLLQEFFENRRTQKDIAAELGCNVTVVEKRMKLYGLTNLITSRYKVREDLMLESSPVFMYAVGLWITDGYIDKLGRLSIRIRDKEPITALANYFDCPQYNCSRNTKTAMHEFNIPYDTPLTRYCRKLFTGQKTFSVECPIPLTDELKYMLLRGIIDGDGAIRPDSTDIRVFTASDKMVQGLTYLLTSLSIGFTVIESTYGRYKKKGWTIRVNTVSTIPTLIRTYQNYPEFAVKRKRDVVKIKVHDIVRTAEMINLQMWG